MSALLQKDYYVLKKTLWTFIIICLVFQVMPGSGIFISVLYAALLPTSAFAYDDRSRWGELAAMMPYSIWDIVLSRYVLGWISILGFNLIGLIGRRLVWAASPDLLEMQAMDFPGLVTLVSLSACFLALSLPIYFRFDAEKSRMVRMVSVIILCGVAGAIFGLVGAERLNGEGFGLLSFPFWGIFLVAVALTAVSIPLSMLAHRARQR